MKKVNKEKFFSMLESGEVKNFTINGVKFYSEGTDNKQKIIEYFKKDFLKYCPPIKPVKRKEKKITLTSEQEKAVKQLLKNCKPILQGKSKVVKIKDDKETIEMRMTSSYIKYLKLGGVAFDPEKINTKIGYVANDGLIRFDIEDSEFPFFIGFYDNSDTMDPQDGIYNAEISLKTFIIFEHESLVSINPSSDMIRIFSHLIPRKSNFNPNLWR